MPTDTNTLSFLPLGNTGTQLIDDASNFMSRNARILNSWPFSFFSESVTVTNTTSLHLDEYLSDTRFGNLAFNNLEICFRLRNLRYLHFCCHKSSLNFFFSHCCRLLSSYFISAEY